MQLSDFAAEHVLTETTTTPLRTTPPTIQSSAAMEGPPFADRVYRWVTTGAALVVPVLLCMAVEVFYAGWPAFHKFGLGFFTSSDWYPVKEHFGAAPAVFGTIVSSFLALLIATPLAVGVAVFLSEFAPPFIRQPIAFLVDLLAAIPRVVYGLWGFLVLIPLPTRSRRALLQGHAASRQYAVVIGSNISTKPVWPPRVCSP